MSQTEIKKDKKKGKGFLQTIKKGINDTAISAGLETEYLKGKSQGFPHPPEIEEQINVMRGLKDEIPTLRGRFSDFSSYQKTMAETENKCGDDFRNMVEKPMQHPTLAQIYRLCGDYKTNLSSKRFQLQATLEEVKEEWKNLETRDIHDLKKKKAICNRAVSDSHFWTKKGNTAQAKEKDTQYRMYSAELINLIHELRMRKETLHPQYLLRSIQAEAAFFRAAAQYAEELEAQLRAIGPINPTVFEGIPGYTINPPTGFQINTNPEFNVQTPQQTAIQTSVTATSPQARALYTFTAASPQELSFNTGDILTITSQSGEWWEASLNGRAGIIPFNYVQLIT